MGPLGAAEDFVTGTVRDERLPAAPPVTEFERQGSVHRDAGVNLVLRIDHREACERADALRLAEEEEPRIAERVVEQPREQAEKMFLPSTGYHSLPQVTVAVRQWGVPPMLTNGDHQGVFSLIWFDSP